MINRRKCQSRKPSECRYHGKVISASQFLEKHRDTKTYKELVDLKDAWKEQLDLRSPAKELVTDFDHTKLQYHPTMKYGDTEWQQGFIEDENGNAIGFIKIHNYNEKIGDTVFKGISICDIEINSAYSGRNLALAMMRKMKSHYNVEHVHTGDYFSVPGYNMIMKFRGHTKKTNETITKPLPWVKEEEIFPTDSEYSFVNSWENKVPEYPL